MKKLGLLTGVWIVWQVFLYYYLPYFLAPLLWLVSVPIFLIVLIRQIRQLIRERNAPSELRIAKVMVAAIVMFFTLRPYYAQIVLEKLDWVLLYRQRAHIVEQVKRGELKVNVPWGAPICELPYEFPVVSNGGNDIEIGGCADDTTATVSFWTFRNYFEAPSTSFTYTNNVEDEHYFEELTRTAPDDNWKLAEHWYRIKEN